MKRSAITRGKPLARGKRLQSGTPMKRGAKLRAKGGRLFRHALVDRPYLQALRGLPCAFSGRHAGPIDPHHVIPRSKGGGDDLCVPACRAHHDRWHTDRAFRELTTPGLLRVGVHLWAERGLWAYQRETGAP